MGEVCYNVQGRSKGSGRVGGGGGGVPLHFFPPKSKTHKFKMLEIEFILQEVRNNKMSIIPFRIISDKL